MSLGGFPNDVIDASIKTVDDMFGVRLSRAICQTLHTTGKSFGVMTVGWKEVPNDVGQIGNDRQRRIALRG